MAGGDLYTLKEILVHRTTAMTVRYSHLSPAYKVKAIDRMNTVWQRALIPPIPPNTPPQHVRVTPASQSPSQDNPAPA